MKSGVWFHDFHKLCLWNNRLSKPERCPKNPQGFRLLLRRQLVPKKSVTKTIRKDLQKQFSYVVYVCVSFIFRIIKSFFVYICLCVFWIDAWLHFPFFYKPLLWRVHERRKLTPDYEAASCQLIDFLLHTPHTPRTWNVTYFHSLSIRSSAKLWITSKPASLLFGRRDGSLFLLFLCMQIGCP